jgi:hypothetical protein
MNVLDEIPQSYSHQENLELDQTKYIIKTRDHEYGFAGSQITFKSLGILWRRTCNYGLSFCAFFTSEQVLLDVELQNVVGALMD